MVALYNYTHHQDEQQYKWSTEGLHAAYKSVHAILVNCEQVYNINRNQQTLLFNTITA
jgi:hypothetical protein